MAKVFDTRRRGASMTALQASATLGSSLDARVVDAKRLSASLAQLLVEAKYGPQASNGAAGDRSAPVAEQRDSEAGDADGGYDTASSQSGTDSDDGGAPASEAVEQPAPTTHRTRNGGDAGPPPVPTTAREAAYEALHVRQVQQLKQLQQLEKHMRHHLRSTRSLLGDAGQDTASGVPATAAAAAPTASASPTSRGSPSPTAVQARDASQRRLAALHKSTIGATRPSSAHHQHQQRGVATVELNSARPVPSPRLVVPRLALREEGAAASRKPAQKKARPASAHVRRTTGPRRSLAQPGRSASMRSLHSKRPATAGRARTSRSASARKLAPSTRRRSTSFRSARPSSRNTSRKSSRRSGASRTGAESPTPNLVVGDERLQPTAGLETQARPKQSPKGVRGVGCGGAMESHTSWCGFLVICRCAR